MPISQPPNIPFPLVSLLLFPARIYQFMSAAALGLGSQACNQSISVSSTYADRPVVNKSTGGGASALRTWG
ncbi:hypothetical protein BDZ89DRAFT_1061144 [Hymenopellis radicata]|nr:hypothetical protein BDZ89DRAFT_1061144 [Hymenopellis radicata]